MSKNFRAALMVMAGMAMISSNDDPSLPIQRFQTIKEMAQLFVRVSNLTEIAMFI